DEFALALEAALEARRDLDTVIVARTDARAPLGLDEAIARGRRYAELGADVIFVEAPQSKEEIEQIAGAIDAPLLLNLVPGGRTPQLDRARMAALGYRIAIYPLAIAGAVVPAGLAALARLRGHEPPAEDEGMPEPEAFFGLFGLSEWQELGR